MNDAPQCEHSHNDPHDFVSCRDMAAFLDDYIDGKLPEHTRQQFEEHLAVCPPCIDYIESYRRTIHMTRQCLCEDQASPPPKDVPEGLISAIIQSQTKAEG